MSEEANVAIETTETKTKKSFKERCKKILPWVGATAVTIGATIVGYKFGRKMTELDEESVIGNYLADTMKRVSSGMEHAVHLVQDNGKDFWMGMKEIEKSDWWDAGVETHSGVLVSEIAEKVEE